VSLVRPTKEIGQFSAGFRRLNKLFSRPAGSKIETAGRGKGIRSGENGDPNGI